MNGESKVYRLLRHVILILTCLFVLLPIYPLVFNAFKTSTEIQTISMLAPPKSFFNFWNFQEAINRGGLLSSFIYTLIIMVISLAISTTLTAMVAYIVSRFKFRGKKILVGIFLMTMFIPLVTTQIITFRIIYALGLVGTIGAPIAIYMGVDVMGLYIMLQLLNSIPISLDESAYIDGANINKTFFIIIYPLLKPAIVTMVMIKGIGIYNDFYVPNLYLIGTNVKTITLSLYSFMTVYGTPQEIIAAAIMIAILPTIILFVILQKYIYNGFTSGAIK